MRNLLFYSAGIGTGGAFLAGSSVGTGLSTLTDPTLAVTPATAQQADAGHAGVYVSGAVAVFSFPASITLAEPTATLPMI